MLEVRQGGRVFRWPEDGHKVYVLNKDIQPIDVITIDRSPTRPRPDLDTIHDAIDEYVARLTETSQ
jgi:hypothetical protein